MKISIVTISYNQAPFIEQAIRSVIEQDYPHIEYIVVDPGSTDGSREIIEKYRDRIDKIIFEPDNGPADGLNKGFAHATGDIYAFINADDFFLPGAIKKAVFGFLSNGKVDILVGNALVVNENGKKLRRFYSRKFSPIRASYGAATIAQQATFFKRDTFVNVGGFNVENKIAWDGELWIDFALHGAMFKNINDILAAYRIHEESISCCGSRRTDYLAYNEKIFQKVHGRKITHFDEPLRFAMKLAEYCCCPKAFFERVFRGPILQLPPKK